jgi:ABC transport system ATP-binding/permease protein
MPLPAVRVTIGGAHVTFSDEAEVVVGRGPDAGIAVSDERVLLEHAVLQRHPGAWVLVDRSGGALFLDGFPIPMLPIAEPVEVRLADAHDGPRLELRPATLDGGVALPIPAEATRIGASGGTLLPPVAQIDRAAAPASATIAIGRAPENDVVVDDLLVSRHHAELRPRASGGHELVDLGSSNGTFLNGRRIAAPAALEQLDVVSVGRHLFRLVGTELEAYVDDGLVSFQARQLRVRTAEGRALLDGIGFSLEERSFLAIVGTSGSGKTTLLNALTGFRPADEGDVLYGGRDLYGDYDELRGRIGFVPQQDIVHGTLTVREALGFAAELRFSEDVSTDERVTRVDEVIGELGLTEAANVAVADLSGGQRRRVAVGLELITKPSLLFLDEPTSGLDPGYERTLMELLAELAAGGRTVVVVTHSLQSLRLCDRVLFLAPGGRLAYFGPPQLAPAHFGAADLQDVFRALSFDHTRDWAREFRESDDYERYVERPGASAPAREPTRAREAIWSGLPSPLGWLKQFSTLSRRYARVIFSDRRNLALLLAQPALLGLMIMLTMPAGELGAPGEGHIRLLPNAGLVLLVALLSTTWLGASNAIREIVKERAIVQRERAIGLLPSAYVASKTFVLSVLTVVQTLILVPIALAREGGPASGSLLGWPLGELWIAAALAGLAGMALGLLISSLSRTADRAMSVLPIVLIAQLLLAMGGLFPDLIDKPVLKQASYAAGTQWAFSAGASTIDIGRLQSIDRLARQVPVVDLADPTPVLEALTSDPSVDARWKHIPRAWLLDLLALVALTAAGLLGAIAAVRRMGVGA